MTRIPANTKLTEEGKKFIREVCKGTGRSLLDGTKGPLPYSDDGNGNLVNKTWVSAAKWNGTPIENDEELGEALIEWFEKYGNMYKIDPNILAAQAYIEGAYIVWNYNVAKDIKDSSTASGFVQFVMPTVYGIIVNNFGNTQPKMTTDEITTLTAGLEESGFKESYSPKKGDADTKAVSKRNRAVLHQNITDNPEIMVKAQARYMKYFSEKNDKLASTALFCYNRGSEFISPTYTQAINKAKGYRPQGATKDSDYSTEGVNYVFRIFAVLGDKDNKLYNNKPKGFWFGYSKLNLFEEFDSYEANVQEADAVGIRLDRLSIAEDEDVSYTFIDFPEEDYVREPRTPNKTQIVLHHTVSGDYGYGSGIEGDIRHFRSMGERVAVHFVIARDGSVYQLFNLDNYGYHLGLYEDTYLKPIRDENPNVSTNELLNKGSIGIEIDSWGGLYYYKGDENLKSGWYPTKMDADGDLQIFVPRLGANPLTDVQRYNKDTGYDQGYRGFSAYERYTAAQISTLEKLLISLKEYFGNKIDIAFQSDIWDINYNTDGTPAGSPDGAWGISINALSAKSGIWSHTSYRNDKSDVHPQPDLVAMLRNLENISSYDDSFAK
jgi:hypothetical protein